MSEASSSKTNSRASEILWEFWYPVLRSSQIHGQKLQRAMLLDVPLVLGRDSAESRLRFATFARTARFPFRSDSSTARRSNARITAGNSTRIPDSAG